MVGNRGTNMSDKQVSQKMTLWAGEEADCYVLADSVVSAKAASVQAMMQTGGQPKQEARLPEYVQMQDGVAIVSINGPMTREDIPYSSIFGFSTYPEIRRSLVWAAGNAEVKSVLLDINSGGGEVAGISDVVSLVQAVDDIKPVVAQTDSIMCSAAYWLGSAARAIYASDVARVGSIGCIAVHREVSGLMDKVGIKSTVFRSAEDKAPASPVEPLSDRGSAYMTSMVSDAADVFYRGVSDARGVHLDKVKGWNGASFQAQRAHSEGMIDGIMGFDELFSKMKTNSLDAMKTQADNSVNSTGGNTVPKQVLNTAAGETDVNLEAQTAETQVSGESKSEQKPAQEPTLVAYLEAKVTELTEQAAQARLAIAAEAKKTADKEAEAAALTAQVEQMTAVVAQSLQQMNVALNRSADTSGMSTADLLKAHAETAEVFKSKFKSGGVAAVRPEAATSTPTVTARQQAALLATRVTK